MKLFHFVILMALCGHCYCGLTSLVSRVANVATSTVKSVANTLTSSLTSEDEVACHGFIGMLTTVFHLDMTVDTSAELKTHIYYTSRNNPEKVLMSFGDDFDLSKTDFDAEKKTVMVVHGFMSNGNKTWVTNMTTAYLEREDVNVFTVDWSQGGSSKLYWRSVANTRGVGADIATFFKKVIAATNASTSNFHFIGHSLGAHICSYASNSIGGVYRITGLDPAMPCYSSSETDEVLDSSDATFVDIIHTNVLDKIELAFGIKQAVGDIDFYVNGGDVQPGCEDSGNIFLALAQKLSGAVEAICSHRRSAALFTESLRNDNCTFIGFPWKYSEKVNSSLADACANGSCSTMGILADKGGMQTKGSYYVATTNDVNCFCHSDPQQLL